MLDARPGFIIKFLKRYLIVNFFKHELSTASLQSSTGNTLPVEDCRLPVESSCLINFTIRESFRNFMHKFIVKPANILLKFIQEKQFIDDKIH